MKIGDCLDCGGEFERRGQALYCSDCLDSQHESQPAVPSTGNSSTAEKRSS